MEVAKEDIQNIMEIFKEEVSKMTKVAALVGSCSAKEGAHPQNGRVQQATYAKAVNRRLPPLHLSMFSRSRIQDKQVLVDKDPEVTLNQLDGLNECELVAKANEALVCMSPRLQQQGPAELRAVGAKRLHNGGIIYDKPETTRWVRREKATFMAGFGRTMVVKERAISIIVKFVLIAHSPDVLAENRRIKHNSSLGEGTLLSSR